jgi:ketosteroid isomerase-like protein
MMRTLLTVAALAVLVLAVAEPARAQEEPAAPLPSITLPSELDRVLRDYERAWKAGNAQALAALFSEDGMALSNGRPPARGRAAIAAGYGRAGGELRLRALAYAIADSVGYIIGGYRWNADTTDMGKFVLALRRAGGGPWLIAADIDNSNRRPGPP